MRLARETWLLLAVGLADLASIIYLVRNELVHEANPVMTWYLIHFGVWAFCAAKTLMLVCPVVILEWVRLFKPYLGRWALRIALLGYVTLYLAVVWRANEAHFQRLLSPYLPRFSWSQRAKPSASMCPAVRQPMGDAHRLAGFPPLGTKAIIKTSGRDEPVRTAWQLNLVAVALLCLFSACGKKQTGTAGIGTTTGGAKLVVAVMPKLKGIDYFNAVERGAKEAAQELGNIDLTYDGPTEGKADLQIPFIESWTLQKVNVIAVACNDPDAISPALKRAREKGVHVITYDADANAEKSGREFFVNQATFEDIGRALVDEMASQAGAEAKVAIVSSSPTAPNQNAWIAVMKRYMAEKYPKMQIVTIQYPEEDQGRAFSMTQDILKTYPDVKGVFGLSSVAFPGAADAVRQAGKSGKVAVVGLSTPKSMKEFVKDGTVKTVILWNPVDLGYLTVYVAKAVAEGTLKPGATEFEAGRLGKVKVEGDQVLLGPPMQFTRENIDQYDF